MSLVVAHISDFHVSRFGGHVTSMGTRRLHGRAARKGQVWETVEAVDGWRIERRAEDLRLSDSDGVVHAVRKKGALSEGITRRDLAQMVGERMRTEHSRLARALPTGAELARLLEEDPANTNLLFCKAVERIRADAPDWVLVTGDVTDDGVGYDLVLAGLAPFVDRGRLLAVPGNHDIYDSPPLFVPGHARKSSALKRDLWGDFAKPLGLPSAGAWVRELEGGVVVCGLDSCNAARTPLSASGAVTEDALAEVHAALDGVPADACRMAMLHHHVVNLPFRPTGWAPWQLGLRLRNARRVYDFLVEHEFACVLNGHRHVGYRYHPNHAPLFVSAPSATLGCRSGQAPRPFYWRIEVEKGDVGAVKERLI